MSQAIDLDRFAAITAEIEHGGAPRDVLSREGIAEPAWEEAQEEWLSKLAEETAERESTALNTRYQKAYGDRLATLEKEARERPPAPVEPRAEDLGPAEPDLLAAPEEAPAEAPKVPAIVELPAAKETSSDVSPWAAGAQPAPPTSGAVARVPEPGRASSPRPETASPEVRTMVFAAVPDPEAALPFQPPPTSARGPLPFSAPPPSLKSPLPFQPPRGAEPSPSNPLPFQPAKSADPPAPSPTSLRGGLPFQAPQAPPAAPRNNPAPAAQAPSAPPPNNPARSPQAPSAPPPNNPARSPQAPSAPPPNNPARSPQAPSTAPRNNPAPAAQAPSAPPPNNPAPQAPLTAPRLTLEQYAQMAAEMAASPGAQAGVAARYGFDAFTAGSEQRAWSQRFAQDRGLYDRFLKLHQHYAAWLASRR